MSMNQFFYNFENGANANDFDPTKKVSLGNNFGIECTSRLKNRKEQENI